MTGLFHIATDLADVIKNLEMGVLSVKAFDGSLCLFFAKEHLKPWHFPSDRSVFDLHGDPLAHTRVYTRRWLRVGDGHARKTNHEGWHFQSSNLQGGQ